MATVGHTGEYTHIVATLAQEALRWSRAPLHQRDEDGVAHLVFHKYIRHVLPAKELLTRAEERVLVRRAIRDVAPAAGAKRRQLDRDGQAWRDAMAFASEEGADTSPNVLSSVVATAISPDVGKAMQGLQSAFRTHQDAEGKVTFERAAFEYIRSEHRERPLVLMEGFTYLTPLQRHFVRTMMGKEVTIVFLRPGNPAQPDGFEIFTSIDKEFPPSKRIEGSTPPLAEGALGHLQTTAFTEVLGTHPPDTSITLTRYLHRHEEAAEAIHLTRHYLDKGVPISDIAIVTRNLPDYQPILVEEARRLAPGIRFAVPPKQLLLTPIGRFILAIYQVRAEGEFELTPQLFEQALSSGWLGGRAQNSAADFRLVSAQFFLGAKSKLDWISRLENLEKLQRTFKDERTHLPAQKIAHGVVAIWRQVVLQLDALSITLHTTSHGTIGYHVRELLQQLAVVAPASQLTTEKRLLEQIQQQLALLSKSTSLEIDAEEFGEILHSLVQERETFTEDTEMAPLSDRIWVTTPEGIDGVQRAVVIWVGLDDARVPRKFDPGWPTATVSLDQHLATERYFALAVLRSATEHLHISFPWVDQDRKCLPSMHVDELTSRIDGALQQAPRSATRNAPVPVDPVPVRALQPRREDYFLDELAHLGLCPRRYFLERLSPQRAAYSDEWQVAFLAQGIWLRLAYDRIRAKGIARRGLNEIRTAWTEAVEATEDAAMAYFPGLRVHSWVTIRHFVERAVNGDADYFAGDDGRRTVGIKEGVTFEDALQPTRPNAEPVRIRAFVNHTAGWHRGSGTSQAVMTSTRLNDEWLKPASGKRGIRPRSTEPAFENQGDAVRWWHGALWAVASQYVGFNDSPEGRVDNTEADLKLLISTAEESTYPIAPGDHCRYCAFRSDCMGELTE